MSLHNLYNLHNLPEQISQICEAKLKRKKKSIIISEKKGKIFSSAIYVTFIIWYKPMQLSQDFYTGICILLGNFADLLGNFKIQTIIWPWKKFIENPQKSRKFCQDKKLSS